MSTTTPYALAEGHAATISAIYDAYVRALGDSDKAGEVEAVCYYDGQVDAFVHALSILGAFREARCARCGKELLFTADGVWRDENDNADCDSKTQHLPEPSSATETEKPVLWSCPQCSYLAFDADDLAEHVRLNPRTHPHPKA